MAGEGPRVIREMTQLPRYDILPMTQGGVPHRMVSISVQRRQYVVKRLEGPDDGDGSNSQRNPGTGRQA